MLLSKGFISPLRYPVGKMKEGESKNSKWTNEERGLFLCKDSTYAKQHIEHPQSKRESHSHINAYDDQNGQSNAELHT